jgi:anti-sigma B factor antagonist/stage II sporulation protein AA (anti-sigma F factor antagonist)
MGTPPAAEDPRPGTLAAQRHGDAAVVSAQGRIDHARAEAFKTGLAPYLEACRPGHPLVLDLGAVDYIASIGLRVLMLAARQARAQGGTIVVAALGGLVREIFEISKFTLVFQCFPTVAEALAGLAGSAPTGPGGAVTGRPP